MNVLPVRVGMAEHVQMVSTATRVFVFRDTVTSTAVQVSFAVFKNYFHEVHFFVVWWGDKPTQLHGVLKLPSLICASTSVLKISSSNHVFDRRHVFSCTTRLVVAGR